MTCEGTFDLDHCMCPVWALKLYLECFSAAMGHRDGLTPMATKEIRADCITKWMCSVVTSESAALS